MTATQLDLFGEIAGAEQARVDTDSRRLVDALTCLREAAPDALVAVVTLEYRRSADTRKPHASGRWAYCLCRAGIRHELASEWWAGAREHGEVWGWDRTPAHLTTWTELGDAIGNDPRRAEITAWVDSLPEPRWRPVGRPYELWPDPGSWSTSHICRDHVDAGWTARRRAWQLVLDLLGDAIERLECAA